MTTNRNRPRGQFTRGRSGGHRVIIRPVKPIRVIIRPIFRGQSNLNVKVKPLSRLQRSADNILLVSLCPRTCDVIHNPMRALGNTHLTEQMGVNHCRSRAHDPSTTSSSSAAIAARKASQSTSTRLKKDSLILLFFSSWGERVIKIVLV